MKKSLTTYITLGLLVLLTNSTVLGYQIEVFSEDLGWQGPLVYDASSSGYGAFVIDNVGINRPLVSESINPDLIFQPNETWEFIIQDYVNLLYQYPPHLFDSFGVIDTGFGPI